MTSENKINTLILNKGKPAGKMLTVNMEVPANEFPKDLKELWATLVCPGEVRFHAWDFTYIKARENLAFTCGIEADRSFLTVFRHPLSPIMTTFVDFCWSYTQETTPASLREVSTKEIPGIQMGDMARVLPERFSTDLRSMTERLNDELFDGLMAKALMYGPYLMSV